MNRNEQEGPKVESVSGNSSDMAIGVLLSTFFAAILCFFLNSMRKCAHYIWSSFIGYIKKKAYGFFNWEEPSGHRLHQNPSQQQYDIQTCCICLNDITLPVMSTCNHPFCGQCIVNCWKSKNLKKLSCPCCRRDMNLLYKDFEESDLNTQVEKETIKSLKQYNALFSNHQRSYIEMIKDAPFLLKIMITKISNFKNLCFILTSMFTSGRLISSLLYIISPIDLLPEAFLGPIGLIDDIAALGIAFVLISNISYQLLRRTN